MSTTAATLLAGGAFILGWIVRSFSVDDIRVQVIARQAPYPPALECPECGEPMDEDEYLDDPEVPIWINDN